MDLSSILPAGFFNTQPQNDVDKGKNALSIFHNSMIQYDSYTYTAATLLNEVSKNSSGTPQPDIFLDGLGGAITAIDMRADQVQDAMVRLANASGGLIPQQAAFFKALSNRMDDISVTDWIHAAPQIAADTAATAVKGVQEVGNAVIDTGKTLTMIGPALAVAAVIFIGYSYTRRIAGR